ncbi:cell surface protein [Rickettsia rhipicephali]|uniref:autotransporter outer membrane beta-barrel domain-containing protein n=1 Tax=Rickettsia rhipicephali TaxID=33992 RepID=UPI000710DF7A|nr:autotransporter outer membrane beta-barrel domain-containing protein [Rickettsia rhipicephali]ALN40754.1 cell surface protein [Rickettsia rhipicephali]
MNKLTEQHLLKKSRFLKYSLLASISVGAIIAIPFEGMAMSKEAFRIDLSNKLLNNLSQLNGNKDTTNTQQQIGTVIVPEPEINTYTPSEIREMKISNKPKASNPLKDVPVEDHYKVVARSKSDVGKARKVRPITRRKTFVGTEKTEQSQNTYIPEPTEQMPQKPEIIITTSSPTVSPASNSFVTAPNTPNTTLISPEHYTTAPGTPSSTPATPHQPTSDSKPNDSLGANTLPNINTNSKAARRLSFSNSDPQQQTVQSSSQVKPEVPPKSTFVPLPIKKSSTEIAAGMVSNISRVNEMIGIKLAEVTQAIQKNTTDTKNTKPLQKLYTQLTSAQKTIEALKSKAEKIETQIKVGENKNKIKKLEKELTSKNNKADRLFQKIEKIDIPANKISIESQETVPVTTASTQVSAFQAQQARINEAQQGVLVQKNQQHIAAKKTKKQQQAEDKERTEREKKKQEAQKQLSEIKKQEKAIKTAADKAKEVAASVKKETSRTALRTMQDKMNGYSEQLNEIEANLKLLTPAVYNSSTGSTYNQPPKAKPTIPLSHGVQRILGEQPEDEEGYLVPIKVQQQPYIVTLPSQEIEDPRSMDSGLGSLSSGTLGKETDEDVGFYSGWGNMPYTQAANVNSSLQLSSHSKDIYEAKASQYINYLNSIQPNQSNQAQIDGVIDSLVTEMRKLSADQFNQKLGEIAHLASIKAYEGLFLKLYDVQQARVPETQKVYEQAEIFQSYAEYEEKSRKSATPILSRSSSAKSDSSRKNNVSGSIPEIQQLQSEKMCTETLGVQNDLGLDLHSQEERFDSGFRSLESQNLSSAYDFDQLSASWDAAYNQRMNTNAPQETLTEESTYSGSSKKKQGNIIKRAVSKVGSILQTNDAENRKKKGDGETSKQRTVDQEGGFGHAWGNENHKESSLSVVKKTTQLISLLDAKRTAILQTTSPSQKKSLNLVLQKIENDYQEVIKISQELQQVLIRKPEDIKAYNAKAEKKLDAIKSRADKHFNNIKTDADVGFNPNWGNSHSIPTANMNSLPNLVDSTIKKGTQPLSNLSTIYESVSYENLASETIYKTEQPKPSVSYKNTSKRKLPIPLFRSAELDKKLDYLDLEDKLLKVEEARIVKEKQAIAKLNQYQDPENLEFKRLAVEARDLSSKESQLKEKRKAIEAAFSLNEEYSSTDVSISRSYSIGDISSLLSDAESNLSRSPSVSGLEDLNNSNVMKLGELESKHDEKIANDYKAKVTESKPVFSCSSSVGGINSLSNGDDLSSRDVVTPVDTLTIEIDKDYVDTYIRVLSNKIQKIEELPGSSSRSEELNHIKEAMAYISNRIQDVEELDEKMLLAINARLQEHDEKISSLLLEKYTGEEAADILAQLLLQDMLVSDGKSESTLPAGDEEQEDTEVTEVSRQLSSLPALASSNECALALSDDKEKECLALGDGSEDEESYDSGVEEEEETIGKLSDSDGGNLKITEVDTAIPLEQEAKKEMQTQISENAPTLNQVKVINTIVNNMIRNRLDASMNMSNNMVAVGAGDEEESHIKRGLWMRGMYGTNNHGRVDNMTGYRGTNKGATIGFDAEIDNNIVGIAYSNVHSVFKFKNSKNNDKELINSHVVSIYGQKELPKNFALQALVSASKNFIKDKTTYSYGDTKIRSNVKHRNHSYNAEALLHYNYLLQSKLIITPNIGLRYGKSRDGVYHETGINVQEIALTMKENNILSGIVGTKVTLPLKDALKFNNLGLTFQGAVEHNFKEKTQRINRVVKIFDDTFKHDYLIPKQPKTSYNLGTGIIGSIKNTTISLDYNYYLNKHYRSHQGSVKLKVNL